MRKKEFNKSLNTKQDIENIKLASILSVRAIIKLQWKPKSI